MRILIIPDKLKGSLSAVEAGNAIVKGFRKIFRDAEIEILPIADGGEGTVDIVCNALNGNPKECKSQDPLGNPITASYAWIADHPDYGNLAVMEMSHASGLWRVPPEMRNPLKASTFGTGLMMMDAMRCGAETILIGLGGSATNDGGIGMAEALGYEFVTSDGEPIRALPENLLALTSIKAPSKIKLPRIIALCDVQNPLLGAEGATWSYAAQKGADYAMQQFLEEGLKNLVEIAGIDLECDFHNVPGAGAAGGVGYGLMTFANAELMSGFSLIANLLGLEEKITDSDLIVTAEGRLDHQTLQGKAPWGVAILARKYGKPVILFCGSHENDTSLTDHFSTVCPLVDAETSLEEAMQNTAVLLEQRAEHVAQTLDKIL